MDGKDYCCDTTDATAECEGRPAPIRRVSFVEDHQRRPVLATLDDDNGKERGAMRNSSNRTASTTATTTSTTLLVSDDSEVIIRPVEGSLKTKKEYTFVLCAGVFMAFNSGYVNGSCLSGFVATSGRQSAVASYTKHVTNAALDLAVGNYDNFGFLAGMVLSFMIGSCITGIMTPNPTAFRIEPTYGPTFLVGAAFLVVSSILAAFQRNEDFVFYMAAAANGIQNGISSIYSENLIRSTGYSGATTDISIFIAQICRGNRENVGRMLVLISLLVAFWVGGLVSFWSAQRFTSFSLLINAGLFVLIGGSLVAFLVYEWGISVKAALFGTWRWKRVMGQLHTVLAVSECYSDAATLEERLNQMFDQLDVDHDGEIDAEELFLGLHDMGVKMSLEECEQLLKHADKDHNGLLSRAEWLGVAHACQRQRKRMRSDASVKLPTRLRPYNGP